MKFVAFAVCFSMRINLGILIGCTIFAGSTARADVDAAPSGEELTRILRILILPNLPNQLVEQKFNWGHQANVPVGVKWEKKGILLKPVVLKKMHNEGFWLKIAVTANKPEKSLELSVKNVAEPEAGKLTFAMDLQMPVRIRFEQQVWKSGIRLYSGETRARCKVVLHLDCESTMRADKKPGAFLPDVVIRLRVLNARLSYNDFAVEHTAGVGGDAAKILGEAARDTVKQWKPSLEKNLLEKANAAIVKAGDTKEIRLSFGKLFEARK